MYSGHVWVLEVGFLKYSIPMYNAGNSGDVDLVARLFVSV